MRAVAVSIVSLLGGLAAQDEAAFRAAHAAALAAGPEARPAAAAVALERFLLLPAGPARDRCEIDGVHTALLAERYPLAVTLAAAARERHGADPRLVLHHLTAILRTRAVAAFVDCCRADLEAARAVVHQVLAREERELLPAAERLVRNGDAERGRFLFAELAAIEPPVGYRLGNLALCLRQIGDTEAARAAYDRGVALAPDDLELRNDRGLFLRATGDVEGAAREFAHAWALDLARPEGLRARGPAITNLLHLWATRPGVLVDDPVPGANVALAARPDATMLKRLLLDVVVDRLGR